MLGVVMGAVVQVVGDVQVGIAARLVPVWQESTFNWAVGTSRVAVIVVVGRQGRTGRVHHEANGLNDAVGTTRSDFSFLVVIAAV